MARDPQAEHQRIIDAMKLQLDAMSPEQIDTDKTLAKMVRSELTRVKNATQQTYKSSIKSDPRRSYQSIRVDTYKKRWGGNVNILNSRSKNTDRRTKISDRQRVRARHYSNTSRRVDEYYGKFRAFVVRFQQTGTKQRMAGSKYSKKGGSGNRGAITAKNFMLTAQIEMERSRQNIAERYMLIIKKMKEKNDGKG